MLSALEFVIFEVSESEKFDSVDIDGSEVVVSICLPFSWTVGFASSFDEILVSAGTTSLEILAIFSDEVD